MRHTLHEHARRASKGFTFDAPFLIWRNIPPVTKQALMMYRVKMKRMKECTDV
jgi:hypothetical protein